MEKNSFGEFSAPPDVCAPIYSWYWNGPVSDEKSALQLDEMKRLGIKAVYIIPEPKEFRPKTMPTELEPDYLTPEYFERFRFAMEYASSLGMRCWLYDEGGWPSGGACGKVLKDHPETARRLLAREDIALPAGEAYHRLRGDAAAAFADGKIVAEGQTFPFDAVVSEYYSRPVNNGGSDYPDLTCRDATDYFLKITHDGYAGAMGDMLGGKISAVFTDEPKAPWQAPFRDELAKAYEDRYGESILPYLPVIAGDREPGEKGIGIRRRWYDLCSRFFCDNYLLPCKKWANAHGMAFTGHMDRDDDPDGCMSGCCYHIMRALRCLDIPGVDVIWRQIFPPKEGGAGSTEVNRFYPRYASSAAAQVGSRYAVSESLGVYGGGVTYEQMRYVLAFQAIRGLNIFNLMGVSYSREGYHLAGEQPVFDEKLTGYEYLPVFNRFIERLSYLASLGERVCGTALYYPVSDYWGGVNRAAMSEAFDSLGRELERNHVDFDIADDDIIQSAEGIEEGEIRSGLARYRHIVIPEGAYLPPETREKLGMFVKGGGTVSYSAEGLAPAAVFAGDASDIRVMRRRLDDGDLICLFNQAGGSRDLRVYTGGGAVRLSPDDGSASAVGADCGYTDLRLESGEFAALMTGSIWNEAKTGIQYRKTGVISGFAAKRLRSFDFSESGIVTLSYDEKAAEVSPGDWRSFAGYDFSGSCEYVCRLTMPEDAKTGGMIDLGKVCYVSEILLDGRPLGTRLMPPYRFEVPAGYLTAGDHELRITVTNTPANRYMGTDFFDRYEEWQLSPYFPKEKTYYPDTAESGLFGPVTVTYE